MNNYCQYIILIFGCRFQYRREKWKKYTYDDRSAGVSFSFPNKNAWKLKNNHTLKLYYVDKSEKNMLKWLKI